jgi:hypothetical protein
MGIIHLVHLGRNDLKQHEEKGSERNRIKP